jgi:hypothetical protein
MDWEGHRLRVQAEDFGGAATAEWHAMVVGAWIKKPYLTATEAKDAALDAIGWVRDARGGTYSKRVVPRT